MSNKSKNRLSETAEDFKAYAIDIVTFPLRRARSAYRYHAHERYWRLRSTPIVAAFKAARGELLGSGLSLLLLLHPVNTIKERAFNSVGALILYAGMEIACGGWLGGDPKWPRIAVRRLQKSIEREWRDLFSRGATPK